jgi:hypothetical protein
MIRHIAQKYLPPILTEGLRSLKKQKNLWANRRLLAKNQEIEGSFAGEDCFILASGPSIARQDLTALKDCRCISVNNFFVHPDFKTVKPVFHCIAPYHPPISENTWRNWMFDLKNHLDHHTSVVFGVKDFKRSDEYFKDFKRYYLSFDASVNYIDKNGVNLTGALLSPYSVTVQAIQLALGSGFARIFLLGFDHDGILHHGKSSHFYNEEKDVKVRDGYSEWDKSMVKDIGTQFEALAELWKQYRLLKKVAERRGVKIINLTEGGLLDVFERGNFLETHIVKR